MNLEGMLWLKCDGSDADSFADLEGGVGEDEDELEDNEVVPEDCYIVDEVLGI